MITTPIFTRLMNTAEYGQFGVFNSWLGIITIVVSLNMFYGVHSQGIVKFSDERAVFTSSLEGLTTTLVFSWSLIYLLFHNFWNSLCSLTMVQVLAMFVMIWSTAVFNYWANEQRIIYSYRNLVIVTLVVSLAKPLLGIYFVTHSEDKVTARILGLMLVELIGFSWAFVYQMRRGRTFFSGRFWRYALSFSVPLVPHYLSQTVLNSADRIMIQRMVGDSQAGIYNLAYSLSLIMTLFNTALSQTISPWIYQKIKNKQGREIAPIAYISLILIAAVNLLLILLAPEAVAIFAPKSYQEAIWVIPPVAMSVFFMYSYDLFAKFAFYYEKTKTIMLASVSGAVLNIILNYICIKQYGYIAAGYTTLVCYMFFSITHYLFMRKVCRECCNYEYPYETKKILMIAIPFLIAGFIFLFTYNYSVLRYGIVGGFLLIGVIIRKKIITVVKSILSLRN